MDRVQNPNDPRSDFYADWSLFKIVSLDANTFPVYSMETNTAFTAYMDDMVRDFDLWMGDEVGLDQNAFSRFGVFLGLTYLHWMTTFYSHEIAHGQPIYNRGLEPMSQLDLTDWSAAVPMYHRGISTSLDPASELRGTLNGLNQQEQNAEYYFSKGVMSDSFDVDDAFSYVFNNCADIAYHTILGRWPKGDVQMARTNYDLYMGRDLDLGEWRALSLATAALSVHTWESLYLMLGYVTTGRRESKMLALEMPHAKLYPPNVSFHLTPYDYFLNFETPIKFKDGAALFLDVGSTLEDFGDPVRTGARAHVPLDFGGGRSLSFEPEFFLNFDRGGYRGARAGLRSEMEIKDDWRVSVAGYWHRGDYLTEDIMGYGVTHPMPGPESTEDYNSEPRRNGKWVPKQENLDDPRSEAELAAEKARYEDARRTVEGYPEKDNFVIGATLSRTF